MKKFKVLSSVLLVLFSLSLIMGHGLNLEPITEGIIRITYSDDTIPTTMTVKEYDEEDNLIKQGELNEDGTYYYLEETHRLEADDGMGHVIRWRVGEGRVSSGGYGKWITIIVVVIIFTVISTVFNKRRKQRLESVKDVEKDVH